MRRRDLRPVTEELVDGFRNCTDWFFEAWSSEISAIGDSELTRHMTVVKDASQMMIRRLEQLRRVNELDAEVLRQCESCGRLEPHCICRGL